VKFYPSLLVQADAKRIPLGGFRVWFIVKDWLKETGFISSKAIKDHLKELGISKSTYSRWVRMAYELGLFLSAGELVKLASWQEGAALAGCSRLENPVQVEVEKFIGAGWQSIIWAAYITNHQGVISRATLRELSGVPERTQRHREHQAGVINQENYAIIGEVKRNPDLAIGALGDSYNTGYYQKSGEIRRRLPNSRTVPEHIQTAPKGRTKKVNKLLAESSPCDAMRSSSQVYLLYSDNAKQTKRIQRADRQKDDQKRPSVIYERMFLHYRASGQKNGVYCAIAL